jgi:hypothetical protein
MLAGLKENAAAGDTKSSANVVEMLLFWIRRTNAHELSDFAAAAAATLCCLWF